VQPVTAALQFCRNPMASDIQAAPSTYACRCLNIRITTISSSERPDYPSDPNYSSVFVNDDGIQVVRGFKPIVSPSCSNVSLEPPSGNSATNVKACTHPWHFKALSVYSPYMFILRITRLSGSPYNFFGGRREYHDIPSIRGVGRERNPEKWHRVDRCS